MNLQANNVRMLTEEGGAVELTFTVAGEPWKLRGEVGKLKELLQKGKILDLQVKQHRNRRSLDANAYLWVLCQKIGEVVGRDKEDVYLDMLAHYGVFTHVILKPEAVEMFKRSYRQVKELGEVTVNGKTGVQLQCYFGSSSYDTKQMSALIDGVVRECENLGIETLPPEQLEAMKAGWGK